jgi:glutathione S-transferase
MKLISATPSPFARKVRIGLVEKGIAFELLTEVPWNDDTSLPLHNPLEKLPVLLPDDGPPVYHSAHIMEWLERRYPAPPLLPADDDGILEHRRLEVIGDGICDAVVLCLFERMRPEAHQSETWVSRQVRKMRGGLGDLARTIGSATYAVRDSFGLADIAAGAALGYLDIRWPEIDWRSDHPNLATYAEQLFARASFRGTMPSVQHIRDKVV